MSKQHISVLVDNDSWILPYAEQLVNNLTASGHSAQLVRNAENVAPGWINFMLGCTRIVSEQVLSRNTHNLVVHESNLPLGRGFAPMTWQILEGRNSIPVCLLEAGNDVDAGDIWLKEFIELNGTELCEEWRALQGKMTVSLCLKFVSQYSDLRAIKQTGQSSYYPRRRPADSKLDSDKTLREQFDQLRVADNLRYPAYFELNGHRYIVKIHKAEEIREEGK